MKGVHFFTFLALPIIIIRALPTADNTTSTSFLINKDTVTENTNATSEEVYNDFLAPQLKSLNVTSYIRNRYARTVVISRYANRQRKAQEATFSIVLPNTAFISGFVMKIKGQQYKAYVREKEEAKREYEEAVRGGRAAAHVAVSARDSNRFSVSMNVEPQGKVTFILTYEELLVRKHGQYELVVNLNPEQFVKELNVDVYIQETRRIVSVDVPALRRGNELQDIKEVTKNELATFKTLNAEGTSVHVNFSPSKEQQKQMAMKLNRNNEEDGLVGQFTVAYDIEHDPYGGEVLVNDGYFVHFFAPRDLIPLPKHVVFVLDVSGSMAGRKLNQLKQAMKAILAELNEEDFFDIVKFSNTVQVLDVNNLWFDVQNPVNYNRPSTHQVTPEKIIHAQRIIDEMRYEGWTNIYDALQVAVRLAITGTHRVFLANDLTNPQPIIIFLTDGYANVGESNSDKIVKMVTSKNNNVAVFTLGFGRDVDNNLLKELAIKNKGIMRHIYEATDAALQLQNFYKEISSPLLTDVRFHYTDEQTTSVTKSSFPFMFRGSELVVAGKIKTTADNFVNVEGKTRNGSNTFHPHVHAMSTLVNEDKHYGNLERSWAYLTIKQLLDEKYEKKSGANTSQTESPEKQALNLALKYSFVTPLTSLVVVKPNISELSNIEDAQLDKVGDKNTPSYIPRYTVSGTISTHSSSLRRVSGRGDAGYVTSSARYNQPTALRLMSASSTTNSHERITGEQLHPSRRYKTSTIRKRIKPQATNIPKEDGDGKVSSTYKIIMDHLPWLAQYISNDVLTIDNKNYTIGNNQTSVEQKACQVQSLGYSGNCTLLMACPRIYSSLNSLETFKKYFCVLSITYAGVCCIDPANN